MRRIKTFAELFEGRSKRIDDFKLNIKMPTTQRELDEIMELPEAKMLMDMNKIKNPGYPPIFLKPLSLLPKSGSVQINAGFGYPFKITQSGKLYYGSYPIAPSANFEIKNWQNLLDFVIVYLISLELSTNAIEKFVFEGGKIQPKLLDRLERIKFSEIASQIAKKYNSPDKIDRIVDEAKKESQKFITDLEPILETETYKTLDKIYAFTPKFKEVGDRSTMLIDIGNRTPYGIADAFSGFSRPTLAISHTINVGADALISVKTSRGLERAFKSEISRIILWRNEMLFGIYPFERLFYDMNKFTFDNIDSGITKEMLVKKFGDDIKRTLIQTAKNKIDIFSADLKSGIPLSSWQVKEMGKRGEAIVEIFDLSDDAEKKIITEMVVKEFNELNNLDFLKFLPEEFRKKIMSGMGKGSKEVSDLMDLGF